MEDRKFNNKTSIRVVGSSKYGYTVIPNNVMDDIKNIGGNSFLVLAKTLQYAHSQNHTITIKGLSKVLPLSVNIIAKALNNLMELGYARRRTLFNGNLKQGYEYEVTTKPFDFDSETDHLFVNNVKTVENSASARKLKNNDTDRNHDFCEHENYDIKNKIGNKENKEDDEEASLVDKLLHKYYSEYQLSKKKLPHIKKLIESNSNKFDLDLWDEIFISASDDGVTNKYKYVRAVIEDLVKENIYTLNEYKKRADHRKSTNKPNNSIPQKPKKDTKKSSQYMCDTKAEINGELKSFNDMDEDDINVKIDIKNGTNYTGKNPNFRKRVQQACDVG